MSVCVLLLTSCTYVFCIHLSMSYKSLCDQVTTTVLAGIINNRY